MCTWDPGLQALGHRPAEALVQSKLHSPTLPGTWKARFKCRHLSFSETPFLPSWPHHTGPAGPLCTGRLSPNSSLSPAQGLPARAQQGPQP